MPKIVMIGAGSAVFSKNLIADILWHGALAESEIVLVDVDAERLDTVKTMAEVINKSLGAGATIRATKDRRRALPGADFVVCTVGVGGLEATRIDHAVPAKFGVRQTVGDTLGVGGVFRSVRSIPVVLAICADIEELCPDAVLLNYTNPMVMHCMAIYRTTGLKAVGLCHGVQHTAHTMRMIVEMLKNSREEILRHFRRPYSSPKRAEEWQAWMEAGNDPELSYLCAGINHMAFFLRFESAGRDLYPELRKALDLPHMLKLDPVRFELLRRLGFFMTETSGHTAEYVPWFLKSKSEIKKREIRVSSYPDTCEGQEEEYRALRERVKKALSPVAPAYQPTVEYASRIINGIVTDEPFVFNGNVDNRGGALITNLPREAVVEVPCVADRSGITPTYVGDLPPQCAAMIRPNVSVQDLAVRGILEGDRDRIRQAVMMDPNTASVLTTDAIWQMCDAMFEAHADRLPKNLK